MLNNEYFVKSERIDPEKSISVALIVAHPDDETLWAGGTILSHPAWKCFIVCLTRKSDPERSVKYYRALKVLKAEGIMGDLDDGPDQKPLDPKELEDAILELLPRNHFDLVITHHPLGEYTRHARHEEISKAVMNLWNNQKISANVLWTFAYEDGHKAYFPQAVKNASIFHTLSNEIWLKKYRIIAETYGFEEKSWEVETTPKSEAFWQVNDPCDVLTWLNQWTNNKNDV